MHARENLGPQDRDAVCGAEHRDEMEKGGGIMSCTYQHMQLQTIDT